MTLPSTGDLVVGDTIARVFSASSGEDKGEGKGDILLF
jgi:hypothetical protein